MTHGNTTHGLSSSRLYRIWVDMRRRCGSTPHPTQKNYYSRGIRVCDEWQEFAPFQEWAEANGYQEDLSIDRIDNNGNYKPDNCQWTTPREQLRNTRVNRHITVWGETKTMVEWSEDSRCVVGYRTLKDRISKNGWEPERAFTTPRRPDLVGITAWGENKSAIQWAEDSRCPVDRHLIGRRIRKGWSPEDAISTPGRTQVTAWGDTKSMSEWVKDDRCVVNLAILSDRVTARGWDHERALSTPKRVY